MRLFEDFGGDVIHRIPAYNIIGSYGLTFIEIFLILFFVKSMFENKDGRLIQKSNYFIILLLIIFNLLMSFIYGIDFQSFISHARLLLYFTLFYSVPRLIRPNEFVFFYKTFIIFTFIVITNQMFSATLGFHIGDFIIGTQWVERLFYNVEYIRAYDSVFAQFIVFVFGFSLYNMEKPPINKNFILLMIILSTLSILMTGTRGWILAFVFTIALYIMLYARQKPKLIITGTIILLFLTFLITQVPELDFLIQSGFDRTETVLYILSGDYSAGGTLIRVTDRLPRLIEGIAQNPLLGWGFSNTFAYYRDEHIGWASQVLQVGFFGLIAFTAFWIKFWNHNKYVGSKLLSTNNYKNSILTLNLGLICLLIIHTTSRTMFNLTMNSSMLTLVIMYFIFSDLWLRGAIDEEKSLISKNTSAKIAC